MEEFTDYDPWYFDEETGELRRSRKLSLQKQGSVFVKLANNLLKQGVELGMGSKENEEVRRFLDLYERFQREGLTKWEMDKEFEKLGYPSDVASSWFAFDFNEVWLPEILGLEKQANNFSKMGVDPGMGTDAPSSGGDDEIDMETDEVSGPKSVKVDQYPEYEEEQRPTEEIIIESAYLVLFSEWGWDDAKNTKGGEPMADEYKKLAVEHNCIQHITDDMADDLTDLLFVNEVDAENFSRTLREDWDVGNDLINVVNVHLVPQDDPRLGPELETFGLGEFLGDAILSSGDIYSVYRNLY